jgi:RNA polymerase sigma-70 factor, ECF subfamily
MALAERRSNRAFARLYRKHVLDVYRYALILLRCPETAEQVTQTTFWNARRACRDDGIPRGARNWLIGIADDVCRNHAQRPELHAEEAEPMDTATRRDIRRALGRLPFDQRAVLVMREVEARSYQEISEILGVRVNAVETLVFRARRALREQLEGSLTCHQAERAISRRLDGVLPRPQRASLRKHLRECDDCNASAHSQRAQRKALRRFARVQLPASLATFLTSNEAERMFSSAAGSFES